ncbi:hypothetical protein SRRS_11980 [Sporomusa rhizae]|uniref:membrane-associated protease 1 n=1 Tax=Sporomusa rhizae TaxID=357999 RepID=UPI00352BC5D9
MGFKLIVKGQDSLSYGKEVITHVHVDVSTPSDSKAKSTDVAATMWVTGKLLSPGSGSSDTLGLFNWALVPAQSADAYRDVTVEVETSGAIFRKIDFPNAFVVDYNERYTDTAGVGEFALVLRQKADRVPQVKADKGSSMGELGGIGGGPGISSVIDKYGTNDL